MIDCFSIFSPKHLLCSIVGLCFALDPSTVHPSLRLSNASLTVTYQGPPHGEVKRSKATPALPQARADVVIARGQYYWEVDVCNSSMYRIGESLCCLDQSVCSLLPESLSISQQDCACLSSHLHTHTHTCTRRQTTS